MILVPCYGVNAGKHCKSKEQTHWRIPLLLHSWVPLGSLKGTTKEIRMKKPWICISVSVFILMG